MKHFDGPVILCEIDSPEPQESAVLFYPKADGLYFKTSDGLEYRITATLVSESAWLLVTGYWNDDGSWDDTATWTDES